MKQFKNNNSFGGDRGGRGGDRFSSRDGGRPSFGGKPSYSKASDRGELFKATCAQCAKTCEVPFKPNGKKPVYCQDCFGKQAPSNDGFAPRKDFSAPSFKPRFDERSNDRGSDRSNESSNRGSDTQDLKRSIESVSAKLDKLISIMESKQATKPVSVPAPVATTTVPMPVKEAKTTTVKASKAIPGALKKAVKKATAPKVATKKTAKKK